MSLFPERLKICRTERSLTQRELAGTLGITDRSYQRYESGEREPNIDILIIIAQHFAVSVDYLVGYSDNSNHAKSSGDNYTNAANMKAYVKGNKNSVGNQIIYKLNEEEIILAMTQIVKKISNSDNLEECELDILASVFEKGLKVIEAKQKSVNSKASENS